MMTGLRILALVVMVTSLFSQTQVHGKRRTPWWHAGSKYRTDLRCDVNSVTAYIDKGAVQDVLEFSSEMNAGIHCDIIQGKKCKEFKFDVPLNHIWNYMNNLCANNVSNARTLGKYLTNYCSYHSGEKMVDMAFWCTTDCSIADHVNQVCNTLMPVVSPAPSLSETTDGTSVTLTCSSASSGQDGFRWFLNGNQVADTSSDTYTTTVTMSNNGDQYACAAIVDRQRSDLSNIITLTGPLPGTCDFDTDSCGWTNTFGNWFNWVRETGQTNTDSRGPAADHTTGYGHYAHVEARGFEYSQMDSPSIAPVTGGICVTFWHFFNKYNQYGNLQMFTITAGEYPSKVLEIFGPYTSSWVQHRQYFAKPSASFKIAFVGRVDRDGQPAVDDVSVVDGLCPKVVPPAPSLSSDSSVTTDGESVTLTCSTSSSPVDGFQWFLNGNSLADASSDTYTTDVAMSNNGDEYTCVARIDGQRSDPSNVLTLTVVPPAPSLSSDSSVTTDGESVTLTCSTSSSPVDGFQWIWNGNSLADASSDTYTTDVAMSNNGDEYTCVAREDGQRSDPSNVLTLTVVPPAPSLSSYSSVTEDIVLVTLTCSSAASYPTGFQWFSNGNLVADGSCDTYTTNATTSNSGDEYACAATVDGRRSDLSNNITLTGPLPGTCNFDTDFCGWTNRSTNTVEWVRDTGHTHTNGTGPTADHTSGYGHYADVEVHGSSSYSKMDSPSMTPVTGGVCVTFWYIFDEDPDEEFGALKFFTIAEGFIFKKIFEAQGPYNTSWLQHRQYVAKPSPSFKFTFNAKVAEGRQLAIDDISFFDGLC